MRWWTIAIVSLMFAGAVQAQELSWQWVQVFGGRDSMRVVDVDPIQIHQLDTLLIRWTPNVEPDLAGYRIIYANGTDLARVDIGMAAEVIGEKIQKRTNVILDVGRVYLALTAYDGVGNESDYSLAYALEIQPPRIGAPRYIEIEVRPRQN